MNKPLPHCLKKTRAALRRILYSAHRNFPTEDFVVELSREDEECIRTALANGCDWSGGLTEGASASVRIDREGAIVFQVGTAWGEGQYASGRAVVRDGDA